MKTSNAAKNIRVVVPLDSGGEEYVFKDPDVLNVIRTVSKKIIYQDSVIDELQSENIELLGLVVDTLENRIAVAIERQGTEDCAEGRRGREMAKHKASIPFGEYVTLLWERNELKRLKNECEAQEREATVRLQKILKIRELLGMADAPAEVRQAVDELIGVDIF